MLIKDHSYINPFAILESISYMEPQDYNVLAVPVIENSRIGANVVALEDIMKFAESNGIEDLGIALNVVCEANSISKSTIAFSIQETSLIGYPYYEDIVSGVLAENVDVYAIPISTKLPVVEMVDMSINQLIKTGNDTLLEAFTHSDFDRFLEAVESNPEENTSRLQTIKNWIADIKHNVGDKPRDWISKQIAAINSKMREIIYKIQTSDPKTKGILTKIKEALAKAIEWLTRKLTNVIRRDKDTVTGKIGRLYS
jgi:hypothetical protein